MDAATLQIAKACTVVFFGTVLLCRFSLLVWRDVHEADHFSASAGLPLILSLSHLALLGYSFSLLSQAGCGGFRLSSVLLLLAAYIAAIALAIFVASKGRQRNRVDRSRPDQAPPTNEKSS